jgi:hypothetical protein
MVKSFLLCQFSNVQLTIFKSYLTIR